MLVDDYSYYCSLVEKLLHEPVEAEPGNFDHVVREVLERRDDFLALAQRQSQPCYIFDQRSFRNILAEFAGEFSAHVPRHRPFYAVKSNHHGHVVRGAAAGGFGLDVSSRRELQLALRVGAEQILFSGPAKTAADLELAARYADRVTVNLDSFRELRLLGDVTARLGREVRAGVRIYTGKHGAWSKFGIPLAQLLPFWLEAARLPGVKLQGIQSHLSWTHDAVPYCGVIAELARTLRAEFTAAQRAEIRFYDFGGGFRPHRIEGRFPGETPQGELLRLAAEHFDQPCRFQSPYYYQQSVPLADYARQIGQALREQLVPLLDCEFYSEPGRAVASRSMHFLLHVVDKKSDELAIVDGGIHMLGWERYLHVYVPIINLTRPSLDERPMKICGSLCDPEDIFGVYYRGHSLQEGDVLLMPNQGAYSFSTAQNFIRGIPKVVRLRG